MPQLGALPTNCPDPDPGQPHFLAVKIAPSNSKAFDVGNARTRRTTWKAPALIIDVPGLSLALDLGLLPCGLVNITEQESRAVARKPRDDAAVLFGLKFTDNIHYKFEKPSFESQTSELQTYWRKTELNAKHSNHCATSSSLIVGLYIIHLHSKFRGGLRARVLKQCVMALQGHPRSLILAPTESAYGFPIGHQ